MLYVLDEPSIGLHQKDNRKLIETLLSLRDLGNTVVVVEHDEEMIMAADWIVDLGPFAGVQGGQVIFSGTLSKFKKTIETSLTAQYLFKTKTIASKKKLRASARGVLTIKNAVLNNLQHLEVKIPLGKLIAVTGVSGSGKSSLINGVLGKNLKRYFRKEKASSSTINVVTGMHYLDRVRMVTQDPIGKTNRSTPATYTSVFDDVRELFANARESKMRGYTKARFSFNVPGGRCEPCRGCGIIEINMQFLPNVYVTCDDCQGKRYNLETLMVLFLEKNIADILAMTFLEAQTFFAHQPKILAKIKIVCAIGLGYLTLGQPSTQLSGGEAQRIKLATYLLKPESGHTLFLMDEPTTGLHP